MKRIMGVVNLINEPNHLEELTNNRCVASVPFGGRYRLVDFTLSNMVNSGVDEVAVFAQNKYRSLMDHLGSGKEWDLDRKHGGLFLLPSSYDGLNGMNRGDLYHLHAHRDFFHRGRQEYVMVTRSHIICNINYAPILEYHEAVEADITCVYHEMIPLDDSLYRKVTVQENGRITLFQDCTGPLEQSEVSLEMYLMSKTLLLDLIESGLSQGNDHFVRDCIMKNVSRLKVYGYRHEGYAGVINTISGYYRHSMQLLNREVLNELFFQKHPIYTKAKDEPPAKYSESASVRNSLIANGSIIEGKVENSILSRNVKVKKGAIVRNSILLQNCEIGENVVVENAILDKDVFIDRGRVLSGAGTAPFIASKKKVI